MQKVIALCCVLLFTHVAIAQQFFSVVHTNGTERAGDNYVSITGTDGAAVKEFCGVSPFWIGKNNTSSYEFAFTKPVSTLLLHITALNKYEVVSFFVNGIEHHLTESELSAYKTDCSNRQGLLSIEDGRLAYKDESMGYTNATVEIAGGEPIYTFAVKHVNGKENGIVFDLAYSYNVRDTNIQKSETTGIDGLAHVGGQLVLHPNPNNGKFYLKGDIAGNNSTELEIINAVGQTMFKKKVTAKAGLINESIDLAGNLAGGVYTLRLSDGRNIKFTLSR